MKYSKLIFTAFLSCFSALSFANTTHPIISGTQLIVTNIIPTHGASAASCAIYNTLKNYPISISIPSVLHPADVYQIYIDGKTTTMSTDNGWGPPYFLYAHDAIINALQMRDMFVEFTNGNYTAVSGLIMRAPPTNQMISTPDADCRIIGNLM